MDSRRPRRPRACAATSSAAPTRRFPADGPETFTDEAALLEACSIAVHVVPGDPGNLKVTVPADLERVAAGLGLAGPPPGRASGTTATRSDPARR